MPKSIKRVQISGLHGWLDFDIGFSDGINVFYGRNGSGKTTMLHILANVLGGDIGRFLHLAFTSVIVEFADNHRIKLVTTVADDSRRPAVECLLDDESIGIIGPGPLPRAAMVEERARYQEMVQRIREFVGLRLTYFPAFRSVLEATEQVERLTARIYGDLRYESPTARRSYSMHPYEQRTSLQTQVVRRLFGEFTPIITYPSLREAGDAVEQEVGEALLKVATANRRLFSRTFVNSLDAVTRHDESAIGEPSVVLAEIDDLLKKLDEPLGEASHTYAELAKRVTELKNSISRYRDRIGETVYDILVVYKRALEERLEAQDDAFSRLQQFLDSVNNFLVKPKQLTIVRLPEDAIGVSGAKEGHQRFVVRLENGRQVPLSTLSSGERQLVCLIYSATHLSGTESIVLIDEPELSLNIDWQRRLLTEMQKQMGAQQIIVCTHSPDIGGDHEDAVRILQPSPRQSSEPPRISEPEESFLEEDDLPF